MDWQYRGNKQKTRNIVATLNRNDFASFDSNEEGGGALRYVSAKLIQARCNRAEKQKNIISLIAIRAN